MNNLSIAFRFRAVRERNKLSQQQLADESGVSRNSVSNLENSSDIKLSTLQVLSNALSVPVHTWFLPDTEWVTWFCSAPHTVGAAWVRLGDLSPGMIFTTNTGILAVKSEYHNSMGGHCMCVLLGSGEYAHFAEGDETAVRPLELKANP